MFILLMVVIFLSGCIDVTYKTEVGVKIGVPDEPTPRIVGRSRFYSTAPEVVKEDVVLAIVDVKKRSAFKGFKKRR